MAVPVRRREKDAFLSHAHVDATFANQLHSWLTDKAGFNIWYDAVEMVAGTAIMAGLMQGIEKSRGLIVLGTEEAFRQNWVLKEVNAAQVEDAESQDFRIIPIVIGDAKPGPELKGLSWIHAPKPELTLDLASALLRAFHPNTKRPDPKGSRDVYVSASWHPNDSASAKAVCRKLVAEGYRLVGDNRDQKGFGGNRIESIVASCGALVCVIPFRGEADAGAAAYKYFLRELDIAQRNDVPFLVFADPRVKHKGGLDDGWQRLETDSTDLSTANIRALEALYFQWKQPAQPHKIFCAMDLDAKFPRASSALKRLIESVTGMETVIGPDIKSNNIQDEILNTIRSSFLVLADLSGADASSFNINVAVEAGMARALERNLILIAQGKGRSPPFMLRTSGQLEVYENEIDMLGLYRKLLWPYRRRIINEEV